jgi:hypothetical protein
MGLWPNKFVNVFDIGWIFEPGFLTTINTVPIELNWIYTQLSGINLVKSHACSSIFDLKKDYHVFTYRTVINRLLNLFVYEFLG